METNFKMGDKVIISGTLTGFGDLIGWVDGIEVFFDRILVSAHYDRESREKALGRSGVVGLHVLFEKLD